jgi:hypothetical protein
MRAIPQNPPPAYGESFCSCILFVTSLPFQTSRHVQDRWGPEQNRGTRPAEAEPGGSMPIGAAQLGTALLLLASAL